MIDVRTDGSTVCFGKRFSLTFQRTLRIPDDGRVYPLPPGFGLFPLRLHRASPAAEPEVAIPKCEAAGCS